LRGSSRSSPASSMSRPDLLPKLLGVNDRKREVDKAYPGLSQCLFCRKGAYLSLNCDALYPDLPFPSPLVTTPLLLETVLHDIVDLNFPTSSNPTRPNCPMIIFTFRALDHDVLLSVMLQSLLSHGLPHRSIEALRPASMARAATWVIHEASFMRSIAQAPSRTVHCLHRGTTTAFHWRSATRRTHSRASRLSYLLARRSSETSILMHPHILTVPSMRLDDATREHILRVIQKALTDDDELVSRALVAHIGYPHLLSLQSSSGGSPGDPYQRQWTKWLYIAHMLGALLFSMMTVTLLFICYIRFLIRKRSFKEHYATWQMARLHNLPRRLEMFDKAVNYQHHISRVHEQEEHEKHEKRERRAKHGEHEEHEEQEERSNHEQQSNNIEGSTGERQKQE